MTATLSTEFKFLLDREKVPEDVAKKLAEFGIDTIAKFGALVDTPDEMREMLKADFGLDSKGGGLDAKCKVATILVAWSTARKRADKLAEHEGQQEVDGVPKRMATGDHGAMRKTLEGRHWKLEDELVPAKSYVERIMDRVEKDDLKAELLTEVLSIRDDTEEVMAPVWGKDGTLRAMKVATKLALPQNPEQLRRRVNVLGAAWAFVASAHGGRPYLKDFDLHVFTEYADHLLGEFVLGLLTGGEGVAASAADWEVLLTFEHEVRRDMIHRMMNGKTLSAALREAWADPVVKDRYLVTPLQSRTISKRPREVAVQIQGLQIQGAPGTGKRARRRAAAEAAAKAHVKQNDKGKGKGKHGKGKGKGKRPDNGCQSQTTNGKRICYNFNDQSVKCARSNCPFVHVCGICFKENRPMYDCDHTA